MKKALIILALLAIATWLVILPGLVGLYLHRWLPAWLDESGQASLTEQHSGWFSSSVRLDGPDWQLSARARHVPPTRAAWLELDGQLQPAWLDQPVDFSGAFGLSGASRLQLVSDGLNYHTAPQVQAGASALYLDQPAPGQLEARLELADLNLTDSMGNQMAAGNSALMVRLQRLDSDHTSLELDIALDQQAAALRLRLEPIAIEPARELIQGIEQLQQARPETMDQQMALLTIAGAWQQLAEAGLIIELSELSLDAETRLAGRWVTAESQPTIQGAGQLETLLDWTASLIGLSRGISPEMAEREARGWLTNLVDAEWLKSEGERFEFSFPPENSGAD